MQRVLPIGKRCPGKLERALECQMSTSQSHMSEICGVVPLAFAGALQARKYKGGHASVKSLDGIVGITEIVNDKDLNFGGSLR